MEEHEEFFPAFQAFTNDLLEILGKIFVDGVYISSVKVSVGWREECSLVPGLVFLRKTFGRKCSETIHSSRNTLLTCS